VNRNVARALYDDAVAQVLDNIGFRVLFALLALLVLPTLVFGFRQSELVVLWYWHVPYHEFMPSIEGASDAIGPNFAKETVQHLQSVLVDGLGGTLGVFFSVAATAFFMPRILEKGAADVVFSKPVSRLALMLSRYCAGLLFVSILAVALVGGTCLGFRVVSGYADFGFLWSIVTLVYLFAVYHAVSLVSGVFTRSTIAAVLMTVLFFVVNLIVHGGWSVKEAIVDRHGEPAASSAPSGGEAAQEEGLSVPMRAFVVVADVFHYALPKTGDAALIAKSFRERFERESMELVDDDARLRLSAAPGGFEREPRSSLERDGAVWIAPHPGALGEARWTLKKAKTSDAGSRSSVAKAAKKRLSEDPGVIGLATERSDVGGRVADRFEWREKRGGEERLRRQWIFQGGEWVLTLDYDAEAAWAADETRETSARAFIASFGFEDEFARAQEGSHERQFGWKAPLKHNAWFSIATTLAFVLVVLAVGWWKLGRIDF
jgi:ABC-type transport system involved in multi-copper enzyme maturation permease subunit